MLIPRFINFWGYTNANLNLPISLSSHENNMLNISNYSTFYFLRSAHLSQCEMFAQWKIKKHAWNQLQLRSTVSKLLLLFCMYLFMYLFDLVYRFFVLLHDFCCVLLCRYFSLADNKNVSEAYLGSSQTSKMMLKTMHKV